MTLERPNTRRPAGPEVGQAQVRPQAGQSRPTSGSSTSSWSAAAWPARPPPLAGRAGLPGEMLLLPGQPAPRPQHRRPGRHQRRQELPERRRQRLPALLRHHQRRRLPRARGQRLSPGPGEREHHRPMRRPGRAVRARIRRAAGQPLLRRRAGLAHLLRPRPDRPAAAAGRLPGPLPPDRPRRGADVSAHRDARPGGHRRPRQGHRRARPGHRRNLLPRRRRRRAGHRRLRQRLLPLHQRQGLQRHRHLARLQEGRVLRQSLLHADSSHLHPRQRRASVQADAHVRVAAQRRPRLGAQAQGGLRQAARLHPRGGPRLLPRTQVSQLRQPRAARHFLARRQGSLRRRPRRRARAGWAFIWISPTPSSGSARTSSASATATCSTCTRRSPARTPTRCRCASIPPCTTPWAARGWITT